MQVPEEESYPIIKYSQIKIHEHTIDYLISQLPFHKKKI
jgi:hypothetical protein